MPRVRSAIGSLNKPVSSREGGASERLPEVVGLTGVERNPSPESKANTPRSVRDAARQTLRRRPAPLLLQPPTDGSRRLQPNPPSIPSSSSSPWEHLQRGGQGWMSHRTSRPYYGLAGPNSLSAKIDSTTSAGACPHCERLEKQCEKLRRHTEQLKRKLKSQRADFAALDKQRQRLDRKVLEMEQAEAARILDDKERNAIISAVAAEQERIEQDENLGADERIRDNDMNASRSWPDSPRSRDSAPAPPSQSSISSSPRTPITSGCSTVIVRPAPCPEGATEEEKAWVAAAETEGFVVVAGPALLGDGHPWGKKRLCAPTPAQRRCVVLARRTTQLPTLSATKHFLLVRPPTAAAIEFDELKHAICLAGCAVGCTITEGHPQRGRLRVLPSPSTTLVIPGGTYVEELWLSSLKVSDEDALQEMKEWTSLLQALTFE